MKTAGDHFQRRNSAEVLGNRVGAFIMSEGKQVLRFYIDFAFPRKELLHPCIGQHKRQGNSFQPEKGGIGKLQVGAFYIVERIGCRSAV